VHLGDAVLALNGEVECSLLHHDREADLREVLLVLDLSGRGLAVRDAQDLREVPFVNPDLHLVPESEASMVLKYSTCSPVTLTNFTADFKLPKLCLLNSSPFLQTATHYIGTKLHQPQRIGLS
jgi:hypothetical protein